MTGGVAALTVEADLTVSINGAEVVVTSTGQRILVQFDSLPDAVRAFRDRPVGWQRFLTGLDSPGDITVEFRIQDRIVAVAGTESQPGLVSRLADLGHLEVRISGLLGAVYAEVRKAVTRVLR